MMFFFVCLDFCCCCCLSPKMINFEENCFSIFFFWFIFAGMDQINQSIDRPEKKTYFSSWNSEHIVLNRRVEENLDHHHSTLQLLSFDYLTFSTKRTRNRSICITCVCVCVINVSIEKRPKGKKNIGCHNNKKKEIIDDL